ncbi:PREDICTED: 5'-3' exoribonuclease 4-like isoform X2 [Nelumbo nucifera]|uniref:5'-3' exoribonuclease n=2 Tax=Nelumbo nucifera TaxID=4432 RepID=A0A822ZWD1_NELNU|nr:PREDICTED: 5'-3' exoribonuclease 4-like isoform X2 [Nelumbo nucifera]DAD47579.1 TPA_asm: hypothetical protein HUJ06_017516 [Nelumbo nucifera]
MGIPGFYGWLVRKYSDVKQKVREEFPVTIDGVTIPVDTSIPNPNGIEFDNLYIDMNGVIHPCFHPEDQPSPKTYEEVFKAIFKYIDRIFSLIRPRKLLYLAIDGVAPRAKMNHQRSRRFRAAKDAAEKAARMDELKDVGSDLGTSSGLEENNKMDSNVITPGTEFMASLSSALRYYIHLRMNSDPGWRSIKVILSDASVPGEGEHKIMSYIRLQRNLPGFNPNTRHCLYGLDADLIMLALATHEVHFSILREVVRKPHVKGNKSVTDRRKKIRKRGRVQDKNKTSRFEFLNIWVLKSCIASEMRIPNGTIQADLERLIDDFVLISLFVGNDFLPQLPGLEISKGAIELLMAVYKEEFERMGGYLTNSFEVNLKRVEHFIQAVGSHESAIFSKRIKKAQMARFLELAKSKRKQRRKPDKWLKFKQKVSSQYSWLLPKPVSKEIQITNNNASDAANTLIEINLEEVNLEEVGCKERYYAEKFEAKTKDDYVQIRSDTVFKYIEGICWVMHYYYEGICSWQWFYPYHYAPFASDFYALDQLNIHFTLGEPFKPFDQLMGVLPAASAHALPIFYRKLMTDPSSPIIDFYPTDFEIDLNGKRYEWQTICKLPFIKESRLLAEIAKVEHTLTDEEKQRNNIGLDVLFVHTVHPLSVKIFSFYWKKKDHPKVSKAKVKQKIDPVLSGGMNGFMCISDKPVWFLEIDSPMGDMEKIRNNKIISVFYKCPRFHCHIPRPPKGVVFPKLIKKQGKLPATVLLHGQSVTQGPICSERSRCTILSSNSDSGQVKFDREFVLDHHTEKQQKIMGPSHVMADGSFHLSNSKEAICEEIDGGIQSSSCITGNKIRKRKRGEKKQVDNGFDLVGIMADGSVYPSNSERDCDEEIKDGKLSCMTDSENQQRKQVDNGCEQVAQVIIKSSACKPNSTVTIGEEIRDDKVSHIIGIQSENKKNRKNGLVEDGCYQVDHVMGNGPGYQLNSKETVCEKVINDGEASSTTGSQNLKRKRKKRKQLSDGFDQVAHDMTDD